MATWGVVFLHGSPGRAAVWDGIVTRAPAGVECVAIDLLEHGDAPDAPTSTADDVVADVVRRVRSLEGPVVLVGHSFGAWVAGRAIAELGTAVERFVALAGVPGVDAAIAERSSGFAAALESGQLSLDAAAGLAIDLWLPTNDRQPEDVKFISELIREDSVARLARVLRRQTDLADTSRWVAPHHVRTTSIHNSGDRGVPVAFGRQLAALSSDSEWIELPGDGHYAQWTHRDIVTRAVFGG